MIPNYEIHALSQIKGIGPSRIRKICNSCKKLKSILELSESDFNKIEGIPKSVLNKINSIDFIGSQTTLNEHEERGIEYLTFFDAKYPKLLTTELVKNGFAIISGFARGVDFFST